MGRGKPLGDKKRKLIIADYVRLQNYREVARVHGVSDVTVRRLVAKEPKVSQDVAQKQIENTEDTLAYMASQHETKKRIADKLLKAIETKAETVDMFTNVKDLTTAYGIIVDKELKFAEIKGLAGEHPEAYNELPARVMGSEWVDVNRSIDDREYSQYDFRGGRGSLKSSFCGLKLIDLIMRNNRFCGLAIRQLKDNLRDSVYSQIVWAIDELGLTDEFHCRKSPLEIRRKKTGQVIYFRGADDPGKIKSIKPPNEMHIGIIWIEEADQLKGADVLRNIIQSAFRGGDEGILFRSYNTPISQQHYINVEGRKENPHRLIHHSHFKYAPRKWLGETFWAKATELLETNERAYRHEYDGEATGTGANVFENVKIEPIPDEEIKRFDRLYYGLDWGYYPDPLHFAEMYFDAARQRLYIYGEKRLWKSSNENTARVLNDYQGVLTTADSAEPKSIADLRQWGFNIAGAIKGPGSVEYSMKWLQSLNGIIIDRSRCPHTAEEFLTYEYERNKDNEIMSGYPDANNHSIDAVRYGLESIWKRRGQ